MRPLADQSHARLVFGVACIGAILLLAAHGTEAHKMITSRYTYNDHVFPIFLERCGRCHVDGGPAPMSLLTYNDASPWAESIREMLVAEVMPPWYEDPMGPQVRGTHAISARELDILVTWALGGTPRGDLNKTPPTIGPRVGWTAGPPDLTIPMQEAHTVAPGTQEESRDFVLPTGLTETRWVKAADLLPGTPSMVRRAMISVQNGPVLAVWEPGHDPITAPGGTAFKVLAGARLHLQIHYKKPWQDEQQPKSDRSTVGLYFTDEPLSGRDIQAFTIESQSQGHPAAQHTFGASMSRGGRVLAVRVLLDQPYSSVDVGAQLPNGRHVPLLKLRAARPEWPRRYWLVDPIELPAGTKVEVVASPARSDRDPFTPTSYPLTIALDLVPQ